MKALNCPNCGAALSERAIKADFTVCEFCGTTFRMSKTQTPEPDMGDLLLGADFGSGTLPGWEVIHEGKLTFHKGSPSELRGDYGPRINSYYVLKSSGFLDDFDAGINIKFTDGDEKLITAGFYLRMTNDGGYGVYISPTGMYNIGYLILDEKKNEFNWKTLMDWTYHTAMQVGMNKSNRLRVICDGERFRVYINGVLATSFTDSRFKMGKLHVIVEPNGESNLSMALSDLQLREVVR